jgi:hypothetical protein
MSLIKVKILSSPAHKVGLPKVRSPEVIPITDTFPEPDLLHHILNHFS